MKRLLSAVFFLLLFVHSAQAALVKQPDAATITVTGHAEMAVVPDMAQISAGILTVCPDAASAKSENDRIMNNILAAAGSLGIAKEQVRTAGFSIQPQYKQVKQEESTVIAGYRVQNTVTITVYDFSLISSVIDLCSQAGANQMSGLRFGLKDEAKFKDQLLEKAVLDGKNRASLIASALGGSLGNPVSVQFSGYSHPVSYENMRLAKADFASSTPVSAGTVPLSVDVNMVFQLQF